MRGLEPGPINTFPGWQVLGRTVKRGERALEGGAFLILDGRGEWIRTTDLTVPNRALYQAEPRPDKGANWILGSGRGYVNGSNCLTKNLLEMESLPQIRN